MDMKFTTAAKISLCLTALFLAGGAGYLLGLGAGEAPYRVVAERLDEPLAARVAARPDEKININTADENTLQLLPGIGATRARDIVAYRTQHGDFAAPQDLIRVHGIGEATLQGLLDYITVE